MMTEDLDKVVVINLSGLLYYCYVVLPGMRARKDGPINMEECAPGCCSPTWNRFYLGGLEAPKT